MSKLNCPCGWQISNVCSPSNECHHLLKDIELDAIYTAENISAEELHRKLIDLWECSQCGRIAIGNDKVRWYKIESEPKEGLLAEGDE